MKRVLGHTIYCSSNIKVPLTATCRWIGAIGRLKLLQNYLENTLDKPPFSLTYHL